MVGVTEHKPVPEAQPGAEALNFCTIFIPVESATHMKYQVAPGTAFQMYVGVVTVIAPEGDTRLGAPGEVVVNDIGLLHGPS